MSLASKVTLGLAVAGCIGTFFYVTATQELDRHHWVTLDQGTKHVQTCSVMSSYVWHGLGVEPKMRMHEGVLRDIENQKKKRQLASEQEAGYSKEGFSLAKT